MTETLLTAGMSTLGVARMIAAELQNSPRPATAILEDRLRERLGTHCALRLHVTGPDPHPGTRPLSDGEKDRLGAPGMARCCWRVGLLLYGRAEIAAVTTLTWLPARLTAGACIALAQAAAPAGKVLTPMRRTDRRAMVLTEREHDLGGDDLDIAVASSAVLIVGDWPAAIATERVTRAFAEFLVS